MHSQKRNTQSNCERRFWAIVKTSKHEYSAKTTPHLAINLTSILCFRKSAAMSTACDIFGERNHSLIFPFASRRSDVLTIWIIPTLETPQNISNDVLHNSILSANDICKPAQAYRSVKMSNEAAVEMSYASAVKGDTGSTRFSVTSEGC